MKKFTYGVIVCASVCLYSTAQTIVPSSQTTQSETIKIGSVFAKTGIAASVTDEYDLVRLAFNQINEKGGVLGKNIEIIEYDNKSTAIGTKEVALEAIQANVVGVIGATWSSHSLVLATEMQKAKIPMITPLSTNPKVTLEGDYIFRVCFIDPFQGKVMAYFAKNELKAKTAAILVNTSSDYSIQLAEFFKLNALHYGIKIVDEEQYIEQTNDFSTILSKVKKFNPDVVYSPSMIRDGGMIIKQSRKMNIASILLGGDGWGNLLDKYAKDEIIGVYYSDHWHSQANFPKAKALVDQFQKTFNRSININSSLLICYDAAMLMADAIKRSGSMDRTKIRDALAQTKNFPALTGKITFDQNRDPLDKPAVINTIKEGHIEFFKQVDPGTYSH